MLLLFLCHAPNLLRAMAGPVTPVRSCDTFAAMNTHATSREMWDALSEEERAAWRNDYPGRADLFIRGRMWKMRNWVPYVPDKFKCKCGKLHKRGCPNAQGIAA